MLRLRLRQSALVRALLAAGRSGYELNESESGARGPIDFGY